MNEEHGGINGYVYESNACFACHPTGSEEGGFNHSATNFPLTGAHISTQCTDCHSSGYQGTSMECNSCHLTDFQNSVNPNHQQIGLDQNCEQCHTSNPDWQPATFSVHNEFYLLEGAHASIANDCNSCHSGNYTTTKICVMIVILITTIIPITQIIKQLDLVQIVKLVIRKMLGSQQHLTMIINSSQFIQVRTIINGMNVLIVILILQTFKFLSV